MQPVDNPRVYSGRYEITHLIARGGMAQVYRAMDLQLDRPVALKVLFPELSVDRTFVERFRREAQAAANLSHPNIVPVFDWGEDDGSYFIVMEFIDGRALSAVLRDPTPLPPRPDRHHRRRGGRRPRLRPSPRRRAPRREAGQRPDHARRRRQGHRLRHRPGRQHRGEPDPDRRRHGHGGLLLPRAGRGQGGRLAQRHLLARRRALRDGGGQAALHRRLARRGGLQARARHPGAAAGGQPRRAGGPRGRDHEGDGQGPRRPLPVGRGAPGGSPPLRRGPARWRRAIPGSPP